MDEAGLGAGCADVRGGVEGDRIKPEAVEGAAESVAFHRGEEATVGVVDRPFFDRVEVGVFGCCAAD